MPMASRFGRLPLFGVGLAASVPVYLVLRWIVAPRDAGDLAERLHEQRILVKPLSDRRLGPGLMRVTTAQPEENRKFLQALSALL